MKHERQIDSYISSLRAELDSVAVSDREEILRELIAHIRDASGGQDSSSVAEVLARLGPPAELAVRYQDGLLEQRQTDRRQVEQEQGSQSGRPGQEDGKTVVLLQEIAGLLRKVEAAQQLYELSSIILDSAGEGVYGLDAEGLTTFANPATEAMTGWSAEELIGKMKHDLIHHSHADGTPLAREECLIYNSLRDGRTHHSESEVFWRKDGTSFPVSYTSTAIFRHGKPVGAVVVFQEITDRKRREEWELNKSSIFVAITGHLELHATLQVLANTFVAFHPKRAIAYLLRVGTKLELVAHKGLMPQLHSFFDTVDLSLNDSICDEVKEKGEESLAACGTDGSQSGLAVYGFSGCLSPMLFSSSGEVLGAAAFFLSEDESLEDGLSASAESFRDLAELAIEHRRLHTELVRQSQHDALTGLPNRILLEDRLQQAIKSAKRAGTQIAVCYVDIDGFKQINDTLGHGVGDVFLQSVAGLLSRSAREADTVARQSGDEFILILPNIGDVAQAEVICSRILEKLRKPIKVSEHVIQTSGSVGISMYPENGDTVATLLQNADTALYAAKQLGGNRLHVFDLMLSHKVERLALLQKALKSALAEKQFRLVYQPLYSTGKQLIGFEALARWYHPVLGQVDPGQFIPMAERSGLILELGEWVIREACKAAQAWNMVSSTPIRMFVNVSRVQLNKRHFALVVSRALVASGLAPHLLELEVDESWITADTKAAAVELQELRDLEVGIAIDGFGFSHSSFSYLQEVPVDTIKINQTLIRRVDGTAKGLAGIRTIISLAQALGIKTVAEGIETEVQLEEMQSTACDLLQGYLLARPLTPEAAALLLG